MGDLRLPDLNQVLIAGRLTRDPELKYTSGGMAYCKVGVANARHFKDKNGQRQEQTTFVDVTLWGQGAEYVGNHLRKGRAVLVEGRLQTSEWEDKQTGQKRSKLEVSGIRVTPLEWDPKDGEQTQGRAAEPQQAPADEPIPEDDIPF